MKKISLMIMIGMMACGLLVTHATVKGEGGKDPRVQNAASMGQNAAPKVQDSVSMSHILSEADLLSGEYDSVVDDTVVNVVAYFSKGDTCEYWISEGEWKVNGTDTVKTLGVSTQVRLVVNDSTPKGYKMSYTFLDVKADSVGDNFRDKMMAMVTERTAKSVIGTTVYFETDEYGRITKITNLSQIKKQAKALFKASMNDIAAMPVMQEMKKAIGLDFAKIGKQANIDQVVEGYLEELKLLFICHGSQYQVGEHHEHEDATEDSYANDTYINVEKELSGNYTISCDVISVIPKETVKELMGGLMSGFLKGDFKDEMDKQINQDAQMKESLTVTCFEDGWPESVLKQNENVMGGQGKLKQKLIEASRFAQREQ